MQSYPPFAAAIIVTVVVMVVAVVGVAIIPIPESIRTIPAAGIVHWLRASDTRMVVGRVMARRPMSEPQPVSFVETGLACNTSTF
ncbi:hypothetical protein ABW21_db0208086 [Orbilia brochopaga]|nr:hypothetical protein ABW21_db0208086 [Drechslerella brochopaga]